MSDLRTALSQLDPNNDAHWTGDDLPLMEALGGTWTRKQVTAAFPSFTRKTPALVDPPKAVETPEPKQETVKQSVFGMESSEFGGRSDEDDEEDQPYSPQPPTEEQLAERVRVMLETATVLADKKAQAAAAVLELEAAARAHDVVIARQEAEALPTHLSQQHSIMRYLQSTQKLKPEKSQIDKIMERKDGYGRKRPVFFNTDPNIKK